MTKFNFESIKITTMTVIIELTDEVNIENVFPLLELVRLDLPVQIRQTKKYKIPYCGVPGAILSAKFKDWARGIVKNKSGKYFRNSITLDICTSRKNISIKLSKKKIQMCGADSNELVVETVNHILTHIKRIQSDLNYIKENLERKSDTIKWVWENTKGDYYIIDADNQKIIMLEEGETIVDYNSDTETNEEINQTDVKVILKDNGSYRTKRIETFFTSWSDQFIVNENKYIVNKEGKSYNMINPYYNAKQCNGEELIPCILDENFFIRPHEYDADGNIINYIFVNTAGKPIVLVDFKILKIHEVYSIKIPDNYPNNYPEGVDQRIANLCIKQSIDHIYHHIFCQYINEICKIEQVVSLDIGILKIDTAMINYNYSLQMCINRWELAVNINGKNGFSARFDNTSDHCVTITLPYAVSDEIRRKKKNKKFSHTFMVYKSGVVTQSGPNINLMREAFYIFTETINEIRDKICVRGKPFTLKFTPIPYLPTEIKENVELLN